jgi:hypothetical protein
MVGMGVDDALARLDRSSRCRRLSDVKEVIKNLLGRGNVLIVRSDGALPL